MQRIEDDVGQPRSLGRRHVSAGKLLTLVVQVLCLLAVELSAMAAAGTGRPRAIQRRMRPPSTGRMPGPVPRLYLLHRHGAENLANRAGDDREQQLAQQNRFDAEAYRGAGYP